MKTFAIIPGFAEGQWHIRKLTPELKRLGLRAAETDKADVIISHSGGVCLVPKASKARLHLAVNPPRLRPAMIPVALAGKIAADFQYAKRNKALGTWFKKNLVDMAYLIHWRRHLRILRSIRDNNGEALNRCPTVVVRNQEDAFCPPEIYETSNTAGSVWPDNTMISGCGQRFMLICYNHYYDDR